MMGTTVGLMMNRFISFIQNNSFPTGGTNWNISQADGCLFAFA
jgi:hypothetical protein